MVWSSVTLACLLLGSLVLVGSLISLWQTTLLPFMQKQSIKVSCFPLAGPKLDKLDAAFPGESEFSEEARTKNSLELYNPENITEETLSH